MLSKTKQRGEQTPWAPLLQGRYDPSSTMLSTTAHKAESRQVDVEKQQDKGENCGASPSGVHASCRGRATDWLIYRLLNVGYGGTDFMWHEHHQRLQ